MGGAGARYANVCIYLNEGVSGIQEQKPLRAGSACRSPRLCGTAVGRAARAL